MLKPKYILIMIAMLPQLSQAFSWQDLWFNQDQQGTTLLKQNKNSQAAEKFSDSNWKGTAYYKDKQYEKAYNEFKHDNSATGLYNQANSLANMQKYQEAIDAYTQAQKLEKNYPDAQHNKEIVEKLLEQQKKSKDSKQEKNKQDQDKQNQDKQDQSKQDKSSDKQQNSENKKQDGSQQQQQDQQQKPEEKNKQQEQAKNQQAQDNAQKKQEQNKDSQGTKEGRKPAQQDKAQEAANSADAAEKEKNAKEEAQAQAAKAGQKTEEKADKPAAAQMTPQQNYEQQQIKAELAKIPDDPGGLLRNKFIRDYERQKQEVNNNE